MQLLEVSGAVRHIYIYIYIYVCVCVCVITQLKVKHIQRDCISYKILKYMQYVLILRSYN